MNSDQLLKFKAISDYGTLTKAAESMFISQPALSYSLSTLEKELGCRLFTRENNRMIITDAGEDLLYYANLIADTFDRAAEMMKNREKIILSANNICAAFLLYCCNAEELDKIKLIVTPEKDCPDLLFHGKIDAATCDDYYFKIIKAEYNELELEKHLICNEGLMLMVPKGHRLYDKPVVCYKDFINEPIVVESDAPSLQYWLDNLRDGYGVSFNIKYSFDRATMDHIRDKINMVELKRRNSVLNESERRKSVYSNYRFIEIRDVYSTRALYLWNLKEKHNKIQPLLDNLKRFYYQPIKDLDKLRAGTI